jgi:hypothetical protein
VWANISSFAFEYSTQRVRDSRSIGLSFQRVVEASLEAALLLLVADREPVLDEDDPGPDEHPLEFGARAQELPVLLLGAEAHHPLDAGAVVPAPVEEDHLAGSRQLFGVALEIPLGLLALGGRAQGYDPADPRIEAGRDRLDRPALARGVTALEDHDDAEPRVPDPLLELRQLDVEQCVLRLEGRTLHPWRRGLDGHRHWPAPVVGPVFPVLRFPALGAPGGLLAARPFLVGPLLTGTLVVGTPRHRSPPVYLSSPGPAASTDGWGLPARPADATMPPVMVLTQRARRCMCCTPAERGRWWT